MIFFSSLAPDATDDWVSIELLSEAQRGDILTWRLPTIQKGEDTGHVVTLAETPNLDTTGAFYTVRVYDSAAEAYFADTRAPSGAPSPKGATGVGSGVLNYKVDGAGRPIAYLFAPPLSAQYAYRTIAIGQAYEDPYSLRSREGMHRLLLESYRGYACTGPRASVRQLERNPDPWSGQRSTWTTGNIGHDRYQGVVHCREGSHEQDFLSAARRPEHAGHAVRHYGWLVFRRPRTRRRGHLVSTPTETALEYTVINTDVRPSPKYSAHAAWEAALQETRRNNTNPLADHG
jgi:hypothetical protein